MAGVLPPLNLRYADCRGRTDTDFDPNCFGVVTEYRPNAPVARFGPCGIITIRERQLVAPVFGEGPDVIAKVAAENPAEMLVTHKVKPGELEMFAGYADAGRVQLRRPRPRALSYLAKGLGLTVNTVVRARQARQGDRDDDAAGVRGFPRPAAGPVRPEGLRVCSPFPPREGG